MIPAMFLSPFHFLLSPGLPATTADGYLCPESAPGAPSVRSFDRYSRRFLELQPRFSKSAFNCIEHGFLELDLR